MGLPRDEMLSRMDSRELVDWMAYERVDPFGLDRLDLLAGIIASTIANVYRDEKKRKKPFQPDEFMPKFDARKKEKPRQTWQQQKQIIEMLNVALKGRDLREKT